MMGNGRPDPLERLDVPGAPAYTSVPTFYSVRPNSIAANLQMGSSSCLAAALFGSIHCIGWSSKIMFTSHATLWAWRIASVAITASPVVWCLAFIFGYVSLTVEDESVLKRISVKLTVWSYSLSIVTIAVYIAARITLLVLAFVELQHVPPAALANIQWANVLPFIH
ncbi:hypothetical protein CPC08DRAFT_765859 [Agrocybe pediades]|nr:hypothetical protein CPC08DRAFT_765859 [Agrocybe pediades]